MFFKVCHTAASPGGEEPSRTPASYSNDSLSRTENLSPVHTEPSFWNRARESLRQLSLNVSNLCSVSSTCSVCLLQTCCMLYLYYSLCLSALSTQFVFMYFYLQIHSANVDSSCDKKGRFIHQCYNYKISEHTALHCSDRRRDDAAVPNISFN